jgi:DNA-binding NarL/FixJ family response regulator
VNPRILLVDDHEIVREGIRTLLQRARPEWIICGEASNAGDALKAVRGLDPDIMILDVTIPGTSGLELAKRLTTMNVRTRILIFTMHNFTRLATEVRDVGAQGYVLKSQAARYLIIAIDSVLAGGTFFGSPNESQASGESGGPSRGKPERGTMFKMRLVFQALMFAT